MKELIENIAKALVDKPEEVKVKESKSEDGTITYELSVNVDDMGKIIGKSGRIVKAIRNVVNAAAKVKGIEVVFEVV